MADALLFPAASFVGGLFMLEYGADAFVDHTAALARRLGVSPTLIALATVGAEWEEVRSPWPLRRSFPLRSSSVLRA
jgi:hypothetical protein